MKVKIEDHAEQEIRISKYLQGQFAEHLGHGIYDGIWVGKDSPIENVNGLRSDVVNALKQLHIPVLRWPGGSYADEYHWQNGIGPVEKRPKTINHSWGAVVEDNSFGTDEFFELCRQLGCEAYININMGSGTVEEMVNWIEYMTADGDSYFANLRRQNGHPEPYKVKFLGLGNEAWMGGGYMRSGYYADVYRRFQTYVSEYNGPLYKIASGPSDDNFAWTKSLSELAEPFMDGMALHHYALTNNWEHKGDAVNFTTEDWVSLLNSARQMDSLISRHLELIPKTTDLIVDEWGTWFEPLAGTNPAFLIQQNTMRDAVVAATTLNIFNKYADRIKMANIAQMINVLQSMIMTDGSQIVLTPTYYVFKMFKLHQDSRLLAAFHEVNNDLNYTVSEKNHEYIISVCNVNPEKNHDLTLTLPQSLGQTTYAKCLSSSQMNAHNDVAHPDVVTDQDFTGFKVMDHDLKLNLEPMEIVTLKFPIK
ncbi:alpha-N-arabinofuranosidase [Levilactobacillus namurensis]|uniref:alpha-N-arabinofuranosidase n=1 Tax=Levilactobacillus namurensis TaxID=380393 RepID=UPI0022317630|nr:alpha-L-arabinofuranosidase C-terminal domain-containing protein [Levilactobacillus namurensis]MCW3778147.1 alpha-N-arabinofuranosidase [Levilactobacillus namurensis]MDT7018095.1 alpha-L-arabinofuranosidase C-terminal domain-containing protein [Levilactobacillus namurensis]WNN64915.1 alpha-L-arabinofuranosidase C-terminal domain-containing protein [Levilactobacillus namurensis]